MRIVLWNCNNGITQEAQIEYFKNFAPDLAIIPELKEKNIAELAPNSFAWITNNFKNSSPKGLGVLGFNGVKLTQLPRDADMEIYIPIRATFNNFSFNLLAFWNFYYACKQGRFKGVDGLEYEALKYYKNLFVDPVLLVGDLNFGPTFYQKDFLRIAEILRGDDIRSLYHEHKSIPLGESKHPTHRSTRKTMHHLDHMFGSKTFYENMTSLQVEDFKKVILSDHAPMILDLDPKKIMKMAKAS